MREGEMLALSMEDIDLDFVAEYCKKIGYQKSAEEYIRQNNDFVVHHNSREEMSVAAILLFGKIRSASSKGQGYVLFDMMA